MKPIVCEVCVVWSVVGGRWQKGVDRACVVGSIPLALHWLLLCPPYSYSPIQHELAIYTQRPPTTLPSLDLAHSRFISPDQMICHGPVTTARGIPAPRDRQAILMRGGKAGEAGGPNDDRAGDHRACVLCPALAASRVADCGAHDRNQKRKNRVRALHTQRRNGTLSSSKNRSRSLIPPLALSPLISGARPPCVLARGIQSPSETRATSKGTSTSEPAGETGEGSPATGNTGRHLPLGTHCNLIVQLRGGEWTVDRSERDRDR
jgi:hypothetical protein